MYAQLGRLWTWQAGRQSRVYQNRQADEFDSPSGLVPLRLERSAQCLRVVQE